MPTPRWRRPALRKNEVALICALAKCQLDPDQRSMVKTRDIEWRLRHYRGWFSTNAKRLGKWQLVTHTRNGYAELTDPGWAMAALLLFARETDAK